MVLVDDVFRSISDKKSLELFRIVALANSQPDGTGDVLISKTRLTRKQYYVRMSGLIKAGLIKRRNGRHSLTALGKVVYNAQMKIENAINNYWKLKAIDSLEDSGNLTIEEHKKLIDELIDNQEIKDILVSNNDNGNNNNNKIESAQPSLRIEQKQKQTNKEK
jgi:polyhydroxyalkanoate synthesis regulator phasin